MSLLRRDLRLATADGPGSGRFLSAALLDALDGGANLTKLRFDTSTVLAGTWSVDFVFWSGPDIDDEVVRVGLDQTGRVVNVELLRSAGDQARQRYRDGEQLASALRDTAVAAVKLDGAEPAGQPCALSIITEDDAVYVLDLAAFEPLRR